MASMHRYGWGYRLSRANTLHLVDHEEMQRYLLARQIECELPPCHEQAYGILTHTAAFYLCSEHLVIAESGGHEAIAVVKAVTSSYALLVEEMIRYYYDTRDGVESIILQKQPGVPTLGSAIEKLADTSQLEKEMEIKGDEVLSLDMFIS